MKNLPRCDFDYCFAFNKETHAVVRDFLSVKVLCDEHHSFIKAFFAKIAECSRTDTKDEKCFRNHNADLYPPTRKENSLRFDGKYYDLCPVHLRIYERCFNYYVL